MYKRLLLLIGLCLLLLAFAACNMVESPEGPTPTPVPTLPPETDEMDEPTGEPAGTDAGGTDMPEDGDTWTSSADAPEGVDALVDTGAGASDQTALANVAGAALGAIVPQNGAAGDAGTAGDTGAGGDVGDIGDAVEPGDTGDAGGEDPLSAAGETPPPEDQTPPPVSIIITPEPGETPMLLDPIDKPTEAPVVAVYRPYTNDVLNVSFNVPLLWDYYSSAETNMAFYEKESDATEGYPASLKVQAYSFGSEQKAEDAKTQLVEIMNELSMQEWDSFSYNNDAASATMDKAKGYYGYYNAVYQGVKIKGRVMVVAHGTWLYQVRISCPLSKYGAYEDVYREVRSSWKFL